LFLAFLAFTPARAQVPVRPAGVPDGYVITPFGYSHPSCVRELPEGDTLLADGLVIQHANGAIENIPACGYPDYTARGEIVTAQTISGNYIERVEATTPTSYGELTATWTVPQVPTSTVNGQPVYFFPALEEYPGTLSVLQPVLAWNDPNTLPGKWGIASWNCCDASIPSNKWHSPPVSVTPNDKIEGIIKSTCGAGTLSCPTWNVITTDLSTKQTTTLAKTSSLQQVFDWAYGGALEVGTLSDCSDYPPNGRITFSVALYDNNFVLISNPDWSIIYPSPDFMPQCGYVGDAAGNTVTLGYLPTVRLNPSGTVQVSSTPPPYSTEVVDSSGQLNPLAAPADITITLFRQVISQCSKGFTRNDTVVVSQGQTTGTFSDYAGRDPKCPTLPITTKWTITGAVLAPTNLSLNLSVVPSQQLTLSAVF
jgi:hypothetical protein